MLELVLCSTFLGGFLLTSVFFLFVCFFFCCFFFFSICANQTTELIPAKDKLRHMSHNTASQEKKERKLEKAI